MGFSFLKSDAPCSMAEGVRDTNEVGPRDGELLRGAQAGRW